MYSYILKYDVTGRISVDTHLGLRLAAGNTRKLHIYQENGDTLCSLLGQICLCKDNSVICDRCAGDEALTSVQHIVVTVLNRSCGHAASIGACPRLSQRKADVLLTLCHRDQIFLKLFLIAAGKKRTSAKRVGRICIDSKNRTYSGKFFIHQNICQAVTTLTAVFYRNLNAWKTIFGHFLIHFCIKSALFIQLFLNLGRKLRLRKVTEVLSH